MAMLSSKIIEFDIVAHTFREIEVDFTSLPRIDLTTTNKVYWIHCDLNNLDFLKQIAKLISLPEEVQKWCEQNDNIPKLSDNDESLTLQIQCPLETKVLDSEVFYGNLIIHLTDRYCFTATAENQPALTEFIKTYTKSTRYAKTPCFILFLILDDIVNDYAKLLYNVELISDEIDLRIRASKNNIYQEVMDLKQQVMRIKRYIIAIREMLVRLSGRNISVVSEQCRVSLNNLSNHSHMIIHETDSLRDMINGFLGQLDNSLMQKMNETMKVLTAFAAIFLPLTLITGIYGMNFQWIPELSWKYGYFWALFLIVFFGLIMFYIFKRRKWF